MTSNHLDLKLLFFFSKNSKHHHPKSHLTYCILIMLNFQEKIYECMNMLFDM